MGFMSAFVRWEESSIRRLMDWQGPCRFDNIGSQLCLIFGLFFTACRKWSLQLVWRNTEFETYDHGFWCTNIVWYCSILRPEYCTKVNLIHCQATEFSLTVWTVLELSSSHDLPSHLDLYLPLLSCYTNYPWLQFINSHFRRERWSLSSLLELHILCKNFRTHPTKDRKPWFDIAAKRNWQMQAASSTLRNNSTAKNAKPLSTASNDSLVMKQPSWLISVAL